jgi:general nucleoside transport system permease protein
MYDGASGVLVYLPLVGWLIEMFLNQGPITMSVLVLVIFLQVMLFRSRWGLRTRAVGEHPKAADTVGIDVIRLRYQNVILGGVFAGLAGAFLTLENVGSFQNGMTAGRGFIALAAVIFGRWTPVGAFFGALLFMGSQALGTAIRSDPPTGQLGDALIGIQQGFPSLYNNFFAALPYVLTIIILAGVVGRSVAPAAVGRPYQKEAPA